MKLTIKELQDLETEMLVEIDKICKKHSLIYYIIYGTALGAKRHGGPIPWDADADIIIPYNELNRFIKVVREELPDKFFLDFYDINKYYTPTFPRVGLKGYSTATLHLDVFMFCGLPSNKEEQYKFKKKVFKLRKMHFYKINGENYRGKLSIKHKLKLLFYKTLFSFKSLKKIRKEFEKLCRIYPLEHTEYITNPSSGVNDMIFMEKDYLGNGVEMEYNGHKVNAPEKIHEYLQHTYGDYMQLPPQEERDKVNSSYNIIKLEL